LDDVILFAGPIEFHPSADQVVQRQLAFAGHFQADHALAALSLESGLVGARFGHELPAVDKGPFFGQGKVALGMKFFRRGVIAVGMTAGQQFLNRFD
jgi:hypothetical protein